MLPLTRPALQFQSPSGSVQVARSGASYIVTRALGSGWTVEHTLSPAASNDIRVLRGVTITDGVTPVQIGDTNSIYEYAIKVGLADASQWAGNEHGRDLETGLQVYVDGVAVTVEDSATVAGTSVAIGRTSVLIDGTTDIAFVDVTYRATRAGFDVDTRIRWLRDLFAGQAYLAMFPLTTQVDRGKVEGGAVADLTVDSGAKAAGGKVRTAWAWQHAGNLAGGMLLRDLSTVRYWTATDAKDLWIEDREDGLNKIYSGFDASEGISAGDVWTAGYRILAARFDGGAAATLADI